MPKTVYDENGNEMEVPTDEELQEMQQSQEEKQKLQDELEKTKEELNKLENKDFNFKKLRDMNEEEKQKLSEVERQLKEKQEEIEEQQQKFSEQVVSSWKNEALMALVGNDEDTQKQVLENYDRIKGEANSREDVYQKMRDAFNMTQGASQTGNPLFQGHNLSGNYSDQEAKDKSKPPEVNKDLAKRFGIGEDDINKYYNK